MSSIRRFVGSKINLVLGLLVIAYMLIPIAVVIMMSFNDSSKHKNLYSFQKFTWSNWTHVCQPSGMCSAVGKSLEIGLAATVVATILGTLAAFALVRHQFAGRGLVNMIIFLPMASPEIVMGSSLLSLFVSVRLGGHLGMVTIFIAHVMFCLSFVIITVKARLGGMNDNLEQAAADLYATPWQTFWRVTFPLVLPGILAAALLSFSLSFDDYIITNLNAGQTTTFPMFVWGAAQRGVPMQVNVIGTIMFLLAVTFVIIGDVLGRRGQRGKAA